MKPGKLHGAGAVSISIYFLLGRDTFPSNPFIPALVIIFVLWPSPKRKAEYLRVSASGYSRTSQNCHMINVESSVPTSGSQIKKARGPFIYFFSFSG